MNSRTTVYREHLFDNQINSFCEILV